MRFACIHFVLTSSALGPRLLPSCLSPSLDSRKTRFKSHDRSSLIRESANVMKQRCQCFLSTKHIQGEATEMQKLIYLSRFRPPYYIFFSFWVLCTY